MSEQSRIPEWLAKVPPTNIVCTACGSNSAESRMHGGMFWNRCSSCGWEQTGTYSGGRLPTGLPAAKPHRIVVQWGGQAPSANALSTLRSVSILAKSMSLSELAFSLNSGREFDLGLIADHKRPALCRRLEAAGYLVSEIAVSLG